MSSLPLRAGRNKEALGWSSRRPRLDQALSVGNAARRLRLPQGSQTRQASSAIRQHRLVGLLGSGPRGLLQLARVQGRRRPGSWSSRRRRELHRGESQRKSRQGLEKTLERAAIAQESGCMKPHSYEFLFRLELIQPVPIKRKRSEAAVGGIAGNQSGKGNPRVGTQQAGEHKAPELPQTTRDRIAGGAADRHDRQLVLSPSRPRNTQSEGGGPRTKLARDQGFRSYGL